MLRENVASHLPSHAANSSLTSSQLSISVKKRKTDRKGTFLKTGIIKDRNGMGLTEAEDKKRRQEYTEELKKKIFTSQIITMV